MLTGAEQRQNAVLSRHSRTHPSYSLGHTSILSAFDNPSLLLSYRSHPRAQTGSFTASRISPSVVIQARREATSRSDSFSFTSVTLMECFFTAFTCNSFPASIPIIILYHLVLPGTIISRAWRAYAGNSLPQHSYLVCPRQLRAIFQTLTSTRKEGQILYPGRPWS